MIEKIYNKLIEIATFLCAIDVFSNRINDINVFSNWTNAILNWINAIDVILKIFS